MKIEILYFEDCPNHHEAERLVREVMTELRKEAEIVRVEVADKETAGRVKFPGSPTIRVDGVDVVPEEQSGPYSLRCRIYQTEAGFAGVPDRHAIWSAINGRTA